MSMVLTTVALSICSTSGSFADVVAESLEPVAGCPGGNVVDEGGGKAGYMDAGIFCDGGTKGSLAGFLSHAARVSAARTVIKAVCFIWFPCFGLAGQMILPIFGLRLSPFKWPLLDCRAGIVRAGIPSALRGDDQRPGERSWLAWSNGYGQ